VCVCVWVCIYVKIIDVPQNKNTEKCKRKEH